MATSNSFEKKISLCIAVIGLVLGVLPEFISDELKANIKDFFGKYYDIVWMTMFVISSGVFLYLTYNNDKPNIKKINKGRVRGRRNDVNQGTSQNTLSTDIENSIDINGDENKYKQG